MIFKFTDFENINLAELFPFVCIDIETTGIKRETAEIIEVSAIKYDYGFVEAGRYSTYCKAEKGVNDFSFAVNGLSDRFLSAYKPFRAYRLDFEEFIDGCNIVGYNVGFDLDFLSFNGTYFNSYIKYFDVLRLARKKLKKAPGCRQHYTDWDVLNHKLTTLCDYYGICRDNAHDSLADCEMTVEVLKKLLNY